MTETGFPVVNGLTETSRDAESMHERLIAVLSQRRGGSQQKVADALALLEDASNLEGNEDVRERLQAAVTLIRGTGRKKDRDE